MRNVAKPSLVVSAFLAVRAIFFASIASYGAVFARLIINAIIVPDDKFVDTEPVILSYYGGLSAGFVFLPCILAAMYVLWILKKDSFLSWIAACGLIAFFAFFVAYAIAGLPAAIYGVGGGLAGVFAGAGLHRVYRLL